MKCRILLTIGISTLNSPSAISATRMIQRHQDDQAIRLHARHRFANAIRQHARQYARTVQGRDRRQIKDAQHNVNIDAGPAHQQQRFTQPRHARLQVIADNHDQPPAERHKEVGARPGRVSAGAGDDN